MICRRDYSPGPQTLMTRLELTEQRWTMPGGHTVMRWTKSGERM